MPLSHKARRYIPFSVVSQSGLWTVGDQVAYLVVTERNWSTYYSAPPAGSDFRRFVYVVVSLGMKPNPGYTVRIKQIEQVQDRITIRVELKEPDPGKIYAQIIVHPTAVAQIAKADLQPHGLLEFAFVDQKGQQLGRLKTEI